MFMAMTTPRLFTGLLQTTALICQPAVRQVVFEVTILSILCVHYATHYLVHSAIQTRMNAQVSGALNCTIDHVTFYYARMPQA